MAYTDTPVVRRQWLWVANVATEIHIDGYPLGAAWFYWLQTATSFSYPLGAPTFYALTMRQEKRRCNWYWYAYLKIGSKLQRLCRAHPHFVGCTVGPGGSVLIVQSAAQRGQSS